MKQKWTVDIRNIDNFQFLIILIRYHIRMESIDVYFLLFPLPRSSEPRNDGETGEEISYIKIHHSLEALVMKEYFHQY